jgi:hypothetical protein
MERCSGSAIFRNGMQQPTTFLGDNRTCKQDQIAVR